MMDICLCKSNIEPLQCGKYYYYKKLTEKSYTYDYFVYDDEGRNIIGAYSKYEFAVYFYDKNELRKKKLIKLNEK
jgi:hypothetical protein